MANPQSGNPRAFGLVTVAAGGTPVRATINQTDPTLRVGLQSMTFQARPANTGVVYVRLRADLTDDRATLMQTLGFVAAPASATLGPFHAVTISAPATGAPFNLADIYIDAAVNGDGCIVSGIAG